MKNIYVIPTDKPSRLWTNNLRRRLELDEFPSQHPSNIAKNIYITSDEEIKEGDWMIRGNEQPIKVTKNFFWDFRVRYYKIILTTDQDLIKDRIQAIDDEFIEWFIKNPSCEEVEVRYTVDFNSKAVIIIPKEEPKQETLEDIKLEEVFGSKYCQFSAIENKLAILYKNQEKLLKAIKLLSNEK